MADHVHESWWLIESTYAPTRTLYYAGHRKVGERLAPHMVDDPAKAVRWPDEWGAKYALAAMSGVKVNTPMWPLELMGYAVREHIFDYTPPGVTGTSQPSIPATWQHDAGAYARCSFCLRYTCNPKALSHSSFLCDCGSAEGWSGSFAKPGPEARWLAADGVPAAGPARLWAMHIAGPDDVHAAPGEAEARAAAERFNAWFAQRKDPHPLDPQMHATAIEWPHSAEAHANDLPGWRDFVPPAHGVPASDGRHCGTCADGVPGGPGQCSQCGRNGPQYSHWKPRADGVSASRSEPTPPRGNDGGEHA